MNDHKYALFLLLWILLAAAPGCSKFREMTRRDYAVLQDPFAADGAVEPPVPGAAPGNTGFVSLGDTSPEPATADYTQVAPTDPGGNTTSMAAGRILGMPDSMPSEFESADSQTSVSRPQAALSRTAATPPGPPDMAEMAALIGEQARASGLTQTAQEAQEDFAEFAAQRQRQWKEQVARVQDKAAPLINPIQQVSQTQGSAETQPAASAADFAPFDPVSAAKTRSTAAATPLIHDTPTNPTGASTAAASARTLMATTQPAQPSSTVETPQPSIFDDPPAFRSPPVFDAPTAPATAEADDNPFAAFEGDSSSAATETGGNTLDAGFNFDSGWRPTNAVQP